MIWLWIELGALVALGLALLVLWWWAGRNTEIVPRGRVGYYDDPETHAGDAHAGWEEPPEAP